MEEFTELERQAIAEGLRMLMESGGFKYEGDSLSVNDIDDLILQVLNG